MKYLLDTDICIYTRKNKPAEVRLRFRAVPAGELGMSLITYGELAYGCTKSPDPNRALEALDRFTELVAVLPIPQRACVIYASVRRKLERAGEQIGGNDLWIASHALASDLTLVTNNEREFRRVEGLKIENWAK